MTEAKKTIDCYQQILRGDRSFNRGIRYRRLTPTELDELELKAAKLVQGNRKRDTDTSGTLLEQIRVNEGVRLMLVAVTYDPVPVPEPPPAPETDATKDDEEEPEPPPEPEEPLLADPKLWWSVDFAGLRQIGGPQHYDALFSASDHSYLKGLFRFNHEAYVAVAERITKKERKVSTG
jgi:hypothetical protein